jgi:hypothetical protein
MVAAGVRKQIAGALSAVAALTGAALAGSAVPADAALRDLSADQMASLRGGLYMYRCTGTRLAADCDKGCHENDFPGIDFYKCADQYNVQDCKFTGLGNCPNFVGNCSRGRYICSDAACQLGCSYVATPCTDWQCTPQCC